jgi:hypothetical protein
VYRTDLSSHNKAYFEILTFSVLFTFHDRERWPFWVPNQGPWRLVKALKMSIYSRKKFTLLTPQFPLLLINHPYFIHVSPVLLYG